MKYDRPVTELLDECARTLHEPFTRADIFAWFRQNYPEIQPSTVQAHIFGLTDGDAPSRANYQFGGRRPVLERVGRGLYRRARGGGSAAAASRRLPSATPVMRETAAPLRVADTASASLDERAADVLLVGCVKSKRSQSAAAKDLYTSALFARRRRYAEAAGVPWFVVSGRWGLVAPDEVIAPYDQYLGDMPSAYRRAWAEFVVAQLTLVTRLSGALVELHAGDRYVDALRPVLERAGATVSDPVDAASMGETLAWYDAHEPVRRSASPTGRGSDAPTARTASTQPDGAEWVAALTDSTRSRTPSDLRSLPRQDLASPGLYSWWVGDVGAAELTQGLGHPVPAGLIYAGQAGATHHRSGKPSTNTLAGRLVGMHLGGRARMSTFRLTLGSILWPLWGGDADEAALTAWMDAHLRVVPVPVPDGEALAAIESAVLERLDPPLNLAKMRPTPLRNALSRLRREYARS